jgi:4-carboxymuconolactone decarboxylase
MTDQKNPFADIAAQMQEMAKSFPAMEAFTPEGFEKMMGTMPKDMMENMFGTGLNEGGLDARTKLLLTLAGLTMQGAQNETAVRQTVRHVAEAGATEQHISETIGMMSVFAGMPAMTRALDLAQSVMADKKDHKS